MKQLFNQYKPKFCCECGEKIERAESNLFTSRKYCEDCDHEFGSRDRRRIGFGAVAVLLTGIFATALTMSSISTKPTIIVQSKTANVPPNTNVNASSAIANNAVAQISPQTSPQSNSAPTPKTLAANPTPVVVAPPIVEQSVDGAYYCGARTQKGTPCTRRVRGGGRCWQHTGKPPMLAQEKLLIR